MSETSVANLRRLPVVCLFALVLLLVVPGMALAGQWSAPFDLPTGSQGANDTVIDADGVNLAAVQALEKRTAKLQESAAKLQDENAALRDELARMGAAQRLMLQRLDEMAKRQRH